MTYQTTGFSLSILVHVVGFILVSSLTTAGYRGKPIVIDFSIGTKASTAAKHGEQEKIKKVMPKKKIKQAVQKPVEKKETPVPKTPSEPVPSIAGEVESKVEEFENEYYEAAKKKVPVGDALSPGVIGNVSEDPESYYIRSQFDYIRDSLQRSLGYPPIARKMGWTGRVMVTFIIYENGRVKNIEIIDGSGFAILDKNAIAAIKKASPFPEPPVEAKIIVPIVYMLN